MTSTQACSAAGSSRGTLPAGVTVVFRFKKIQPELNGTGRAGPPTCVDCASAGKGMRRPGGAGETGAGCGTTGCSCSSKMTIPSSPSGYQAGEVPHLKAPCVTFEPRQTTNCVPEG